MRICKLYFLVSFLAVFAPFNFLRGDDCVEAEKLIHNGSKLADASDTEYEYYKKASELCPKIPEGIFNLGIVELKRNNFKEAMSHFENALKIERKEQFLESYASAAVKIGDLDLARKTFSEILEKDKKNIAALLGMAVIYEKNGKSEEAIETLREAISYNSENALLHHNLAVLYDKRNQISEAMQEYESAVGYDPKNYDLLLNSAIFYRKQQKYDLAIRRLNQAREIEPNQILLYKVLAEIYDKTGNNDKAELALMTAIDLDMNDTDSKINLAITKLKKKQASQAEDIIQVLLRNFELNDKQKARALSVLGWAELELGKNDLAEKNLKESLEIDPNNKIVHNNLGTLYRTTGRGVEAEKEFNLANEK